MKRKKYRTYQAPRIDENSLEAEGIFCDSFRGNMQADEIYVIDDDEEPTDFDF